MEILEDKVYLKEQYEGQSEVLELLQNQEPIFHNGTPHPSNREEVKKRGIDSSCPW